MTDLTGTPLGRCDSAVFTWGGNIGDSRVVVSEWRRQVLVVDRCLSVLGLFGFL